MRSADPEVARNRHWICGRLGDDVLATFGVDQHEFIELVWIEADEVQVEIFRLKSRQLKPQNVVVPAGIERKLIISDDVSALLGLGQVVQNDDRDFAELELPRGQQAAVPGDD